jgi:hypothetical protein
LAKVLGIDGRWRGRFILRQTQDEVVFLQQMP